MNMCDDLNNKSMKIILVLRMASVTDQGGAEQRHDSGPYSQSL